MYRVARILVIVGLVAMVLGALDPLEGSILILPGIGLVVLGARRGDRRHRTLLLWSLVLVAAGVGALAGLSAIGGRRRQRPFQLVGCPTQSVGSRASSAPFKVCETPTR